jgi:hypothetical protein
LAPRASISSRVTTLTACGVSRSEVAVFEALRLVLATMPLSGPRPVSLPPSTVTVSSVVAPASCASAWPPAAVTASSTVEASQKRFRPAARHAIPAASISVPYPCPEFIIAALTAISCLKLDHLNQVKVLLRATIARPTMSVPLRDTQKPLRTGKSS